MEKLRIAIFWDYDKDNPDAWDTPTGIYRSLKGLGHEVARYPLPSTDKTLGFRNYLQAEAVVDVCLLLNAGSLREGTAFWNKMTLGDVLLVQEAGDEPQAYESHKELSEHSDLVLTTDLRCAHAYRARGIQARWFNSWCDEEIFYPDDREPTLDVVTSMYGYRGELVSSVSSALGQKYTSRTGLKDKENGEFYRDGKIIFQQARHGEITRRIFEGMGCRKLVFTDYLHPDTGIYELFRQREDIIYYGNEEECVKWMNYFLEHDEERERIANNGYQKIKLYHTAENRAKEIVELSTKLLNEKK